MKSLEEHDVFRFILNIIYFLSCIFAFALTLCFIFKFKRFGLSEDFPWLLAAGKHILNTHSIPTQDIFSWTHYGAEWINYHWLFDYIVKYSFQTKEIFFCIEQ